MLVFELDKSSSVLEIHLDDNGLEKLKEVIAKLDQLKQSDHVHLMTEEWGGDELSDEQQNMDFDLIHHVKIMRWK